MQGTTTRFRFLTILKESNELQKNSCLCWLFHSSLRCHVLKYHRAKTIFISVNRVKYAFTVKTCLLKEIIRGNGAPSFILSIVSVQKKELFKYRNSNSSCLLRQKTIGHGEVAVQAVRVCSISHVSYLLLSVIAFLAVYCSLFRTFYFNPVTFAFNYLLSHQNLT
jgi:hypothetical protein